MADKQHGGRRALIDSILFHREREGDRQILSDEALQRLIEGELKLSPEEVRELMHSPATLRRLRVLNALHRARQKSSLWQGSEMLLLAAAGEEEEPLQYLDSVDGLFSLHFFYDDSGEIQMLLKCDHGVIQQLAQSSRTLWVQDAEGTILLSGVPDEDGELAGPWPFSESPRAHFMTLGMAISIKPQRV